MKSFVLIVIAAVGMAACGPSPDAHARAGDAYAAGSKWREAYLEYAAAAQAAPKRGDLRLKLSNVYLQLGDGDDALTEASRAADLMPNNAQAQLQAGRLLLAAGKFEDAKTRAGRLAALDPTNVDAKILLGNALASLRDIDSAVSEYQDAIAQDPRRDEAYADLGIVRLAQGDRGAAEATFRKAVEVAPASIAAHLALANFLWSSGRIAEAEAAFTAALTLDPANVSANRALGVFYLSSPTPARAEQYFLAIAKADTSNAAQFSLADYYVITRRLDDARRVLAPLAARETSAAAATTTLASIDAQEGHRAEALAKLHDLLARHPRQVYARLLNARLLFQDGKLDESLAQATSLVRDDPDSPTAGEAYLLIGRIQSVLDRPGEAMHAYEQVLTRVTQPIEADVALAKLHLSAGAPEKARGYVQEALTLRPTDRTARELMVRVLIADGDLAQARQELANFRSSDPGAPALTNLDALLLVTSGNADAARAAFLRTLATNPHDLDATTGLVKIDLEHGRATEALARIESDLRVDHPSANFLLLAARAYKQVNQPAKTEALLVRAIESDPNRLDAYNLLGQLYLEQHRVADARAQFEDMLKRSPQSVSANTMLAMLYEAQGQTVDAERLYRTVLALDSTAAVAANNLAWLLVSTNRNLDEALQYAQMANRVLPDEPHVADTLGWIYCQKHIPSPAIRLLQASLGKDATDPVVHYHLGVAYAEAGDKDKARASLRQALSMQPDFQGATDARQALSALGG